ncbi:MAG: type II toxin-antitoxin system MqsA family antitoxin [Thiobacillaceae bacterium]
MTSKWHKQACPICGQGTLYDQTRKQQIEYRGKPYKYIEQGAFCDHCADGFAVPNAREEGAWLAFRDQADAEEAAALAHIRKKLKLTQQEAAMLTGGGKNAFSRYERGEARPLAAVVNLFKLLDKHPELLNEIRPH